MKKHVHTHSAHVRGPNGEQYEARVYGMEERPGGTWIGWLEFHPVKGTGPVLRTRSETSQPDWKALDYWAGGLQPLYLDGAFQRANPE
jgi:hypothetical protein